MASADHFESAVISLLDGGISPRSSEVTSHTQLYDLQYTSAYGDRDLR